MDAKEELAERILILTGKDTGLDRQRILELLSSYRVDYNGGAAGGEGTDFLAQIDYYLAAKKAEGLSDKTLALYRAHLARFSEYAGKLAEEVVAGDVSKFVSYLKDVKHYQNTTIQIAIGALRGFFNRLEEEEIIVRNPLRLIKSFKTCELNTRHPLTPDQMELLRAACKTSLEKALVEFLYSSGCRLSEAEQIDVEDVDFENRHVSVVGKGKKRRTLFFSVRAKVLLRQYIAERPGGTALFCHNRPHPRLREPYARLRQYTIQKIIGMLGERAGIERKVSPHILRHTLASDLLNAGMDIKVIQKILGHASVSTTEIYAELNENTVGREYDRFLA